MKLLTSSIIFILATQPTFADSYGLQCVNACITQSADGNSNLVLLCDKYKILSDSLSEETLTQSICIFNLKQFSQLKKYSLTDLPKPDRVYNINLGKCGIKSKSLQMIGYHIDDAKFNIIVEDSDNGFDRCLRMINTTLVKNQLNYEPAQSTLWKIDTGKLQPESIQAAEFAGRRLKVDELGNWPGQIVTSSNKSQVYRRIGSHYEVMSVSDFNVTNSGDFKEDTLRLLRQPCRLRLDESNKSIRFMINDATSCHYSQDPFSFYSYSFNAGKLISSREYNWSDEILRFKELMVGETAYIGDNSLEILTHSRDDNDTLKSILIQFDLRTGEQSIHEMNLPPSSKVIYKNTKFDLALINTPSNIQSQLSYRDFKGLPKLLLGDLALAHNYDIGK